MTESSLKSPEETRQSDLVVKLAGAGYVRFVSIVLAVGAVFIAFNVFLQVRKAAIAGGLNPYSLGRSLFYGLSLVFMAFLLWSYSGAVLDYPESGAAGARRLERAHIDLWRWGAILLAVHLIYVIVFIAILRWF